MNSSVVVLIPAYCPSAELIDLVKKLLATSLGGVVIVNDGSPTTDETIFMELERLPGVSFLSHPVNRGKGAALKTGFKYIQERYQNTQGIVTADADGQHSADDIAEIANRLVHNPSVMVLGVRNFTGKLPWRSWLGNTLTRKVFGWVTGQQISDTQTGLRGIPVSWLSWLITLPGDRYEYEINMLLETKRRGLSIVEEPISTIYEVGNPSSHFNPITDSLKIYWVLLRYVISSLITAGVDILLFAGLVNWWGSIIPSILVSRWIVGAGVNFTLNRSLVFKEGGMVWPALLRYYLVISTLGLVAGGLIGWLASVTGISVIYTKIIIEIILFPLGFILQKRWVFSPPVQPIK
ncbi:bifunctional glycosyltransferase family 2/GtrA family protein [Patescibacteria group bacterium]|nr:bifunctional glycosyltransferase family 2/GtrA family protein [Patescibacteria group bacterium]